MNPLDMKGPDFLGFYISYFAFVAIAAGLLRWYFRAPGGEPSKFELNLSPYETAYLAGGRGLAVNAAIARMIKEKVLQIEGLGRNLERGPSPLEDGRPVEQAIYIGVGRRKETMAHIHRTAAAALVPIEGKLLSLEFILSPFWAAIARFVPFLIVLSAPLLGIAKFWVGISRGKPIGILILFIIISLILIAVLFARPAFRSRRGDRALRKLKHDNAAVGYSVHRSANRLSGDDLVLGLGLFGVGILAGGELDSYYKMLKPQTASWSSGCGSSSCGGGGGCGGGGCGGCGG